MALLVRAHAIRETPTVWKPSEEAAPLPAQAVVDLGFLEGDCRRNATWVGGAQRVCAECADVHVLADVHVRIL